jgi:AcrR family transcriptional regulator
MATKKKTSRPMRPPSGPKKGELTRDKILTAAIRIIGRDGFDRMSFKAIADLAKVKQPTVFYYFPDKEDLIEAVIQDVIRRGLVLIKGGINPQDDAFTRLMRYFKGNVHFLRTHRDEAQILVLLSYYASHDKRFAAIYAERQRDARERIVEILYAGIREKIFTFKDDPVALAELLHDTLLGGCMNMMSSEKAGSPEIDGDRKWKLFVARETGYVGPL